MNREKSGSLTETASQISGRIYLSDGTGLKGAHIACGSLETRTLADGSFMLNVANAGTYTVTVSLQGYTSAKKTVSIQQGEAKSLDIQLSKATGTAKIKGYIYDAESKKIVDLEGTAILVIPVANRYSHIDERGYYEFSNLPSGSYKVRISVPGYADSDAVLALGDAEAKTYDFFCKPLRVEEPPWG
ncbi:MAG: carboxypeptidase regulatory-like domain-containing protein [Candidatus Bathyarchaeota archaeon]|nr:MAG: carboxypeptidase regulatory-like domain-containing protein [Candidatus Bathyarchaeota archaeon]